MKKTYKAYLHSYKEDAYENNETEKLGFDEESEAFENFKYSLCEVELDMIVDMDTGDTWILGVSGAKLEKPVEA
jgi:hypothetical protein